MAPREIMAPEAVNEVLRGRAGIVEKFLAHYQDYIPGIPARLAQAMRYSLEAGGKRVRPVLCLSCAGMCGLDAGKAVPFAAAIEMIHTYSLIHDDLPAMDNDDLRRGKPSNHRAFDEATAILAGDGLLTDAFYMICLLDLPAKAVLAALARLALAAGSSGMAGGQELDMIYTGDKGITLPRLAHMQALKTGAMLGASCVCGAILAGAEEKQIIAIGEYGLAFGKAFQITDDILDIKGDTRDMGKPAGSDAASGKNTYPSLAGMAESEKAAREETEKAIAALNAFSGEDASFLRGLAACMNKRSK